MQSPSAHPNPLTLLLALALQATLPSTLRAQCEPLWSREFPSGALDDTPLAFALFDENRPAPPSVFATGVFTSSGGVPMPGIARWDGLTWSDVGGGLTPYNGWREGHCLAVFDDDGPGPRPPALYVGGSFRGAGGVFSPGLVRWDGTAWSDVGGGLSYPIRSSPIILALAVFDDGRGEALYVGGGFTSAGSLQVNGLARWDGSSWSPAGAGIGGVSLPSVTSLLVADIDGPGPQRPALYVAGWFTTAGGSPANHIAKWDGQTWEPLGSGLSDPLYVDVKALATFDEDGSGPVPPSLFAGGRIREAGGVPVMNLARWNGTAWSALPAMSQLPWIVDSLAVYDDGTGPALFASAGPEDLMKWTGAEWQVVMPPGSDAESAAVLDPDGPGPNPAIMLQGSHWFPYTRRWDGAVARPVLGPGGGPNDAVYASAVVDPDGPGPAAPSVYVGGSFSSAAGIPAACIARFDGHHWFPLGAGADGPVTGIAAYDQDGIGPLQPQIFICGQFNSVGGLPCQSAARWDGFSWSCTGSSVDIRAFCIWDPDGSGPAPKSLFASGWGYFGTGPGRGWVMRWDGEAWTPFGGSFSNPTGAMAVYDADGPGAQPPTLFVVQEGGGPSIHKWTGSGWSQVGSASGALYTLGTFDDDGPGPRPECLFAGGWFAAMNGVQANGIARWDGTSWSSLGTPVNTTARAFAVHDHDGSGPAAPSLYVGGSGLQDYSAIARWDGYEWTPVSGRATSHVYTLAPIFSSPGLPALVMGGWIQTVGGHSASNFAILACPHPVCYPNCDSSPTYPTLNVNDFMCFQTRFAAGDPYANCDGSTTPPVLNVNDFQCFITQYAAGCP